MSNCFEMRCPKCGDEDHINIAAVIFVRLTTDGTDADLPECGDHTWTDDSHADCAVCDYTGRVRDFERPDEHGETKPIRTPKARQLPPDPDRKNDDRAKWAGRAISAFQIQTGTEFDYALNDLLCDLMHWCDRTTFEDGEGRIDFDAALAAARMHYEAETTAE